MTTPDPYRQPWPGGAPGYPQYPVAPSGYGPPAPKDRSGMRRVSKWLMWIGAIVLVICVGVGVTLAVLGFGKLTDQSDHLTAIAPGATITYHADAGESVQLFVAESSGPPPRCTFAGPADITDGPDVDTSFSHDGRQLGTFQVVTFPVAGQYAISCGGHTTVYLAPALDAGDILMSVGGLLLAILGGGFGALLLIVGVVLRLVAGRAPQR